MKVSIITINYNNANGLEKTIGSIANHIGAEIEYIVIDGNSTDGSIEVIKKYEKKINLWISEPDSGIYNAMNKGIRYAKGDYLLFINSGDVISETVNMNQVVNELSGEDIIYFNLEIANSLSGTSYIKKYPDSLDFKYFAEDSLPHPASFIKREILIKYGCYSERMELAADWAFFVDATCLMECSYKHINNHFSTFYTDGVSSDIDNKKTLQKEQDEHIASVYPLFKNLYLDWIANRQELYRLKISVSVRFLKKLGFLKWLKL